MRCALRPSFARVVTVRLSCFVLAGLALACNPDGPASPAPEGQPDHALFAKAPGNPTVNSVAPDSSSQGTTLDVHVFGAGFTNGAAATWQLNGVANPNKVKTNATTVISSTELVANITIADTADVASWDVQVALVGGKKGIGTELFAVTRRGPPADSTTGTTDAGAQWSFGTLGTSIDSAGNVTLHPAAIFGDNRDIDGNVFGAPPTDPFVGSVSGAYQHAHCGLALPIYWWGAFVRTGDGTLDPSLVTASTCPTRVYHVAIGSSDWPVWAFINFHQIMQKPLNGSHRQVMRLLVEQPNCTRLLIGTPVSDTEFAAADGGVRVTRVAGVPPTTHRLSTLPGYVPGEWLVETVDGKALCQYQKGQRWITASTVTGLYFRIHVTEIPPTL